MVDGDERAEALRQPARADRDAHRPAIEVAGAGPMRWRVVHGGRQVRRHRQARRQVRHAVASSTSSAR